VTTPRAAQSADPSYDCFAIAAPGLESLVAHELDSLGVADMTAVPGGVEFTTDAAGLAFVQLRTRTATRVIVRAAQFRATAFHELERAARKVEWTRFLPEGAHFRLRVTCRKSRLYHSDAVAERVAGAIVRSVAGSKYEVGGVLEDDADDAEEVIATGDADAAGDPGDHDERPAVAPAIVPDEPVQAEIRSAKGAGTGFNPWAVASKRYADKAVAAAEAAAAAAANPKASKPKSAPKPVPKAVETVRAAAPKAGVPPAQLFIVRFDHDTCTISADASGDLLHRRGYRLAVGRAPLRETLAAAMIIGSEWDPSTPLVDPMCGSGTIAIEAAMIARRIAPGLARPFAAESWPETPPQVWQAARLVAKKEILPSAPAPIIGADRDEGAIANALANAKRVGVLSDVEFRCAPLSALDVPEASGGLLVANPPYGVRLGETKALRDLFARLGQVAYERCRGWRVTLLSADRGLESHTRLPFTEVLATSHGGIAVRLVAADVPTGA
jgi:23S rRNA G2445 N2-methylase RlmL